MSKIEKTIAKLKKKPTPKDFTWEELGKVLQHFLFTPLGKGSTCGSRRKFISMDMVIISFHEPRPRDELKKYQIEQVLEILRSEGLL